MKLARSTETMWQPDIVADARSRGNLWSNTHRLTEVADMSRSLDAQGWPTGKDRLRRDSNIWPAIKTFFTDQTDRAEAS